MYTSLDVVTKQQKETPFEYSWSTSLEYTLAKNMDVVVSKKLFASNAVACQMKEYNNSGLVVILHC